MPSLRDGSTLVPQSSVNPHGIAESVRRQADLGQMVRSQEIAAAVALEELGYDVRVRENGAFIASVYSDLPAAGKVVPGEVIIAVDGRLGPLDPRPAGADRGEQARHAAHTHTASFEGAAQRPFDDRAQPGRPQPPVIGVLVEPAADIRLPIDVSIDAGNIGGLSAGPPSPT